MEDRRVVGQSVPWEPLLFCPTLLFLFMSCKHEGMLTLWLLTFSCAQLGRGQHSFMPHIKHLKISDCDSNLFGSTGFFLFWDARTATVSLACLVQIPFFVQRFMNKLLLSDALSFSCFSCSRLLLSISSIKANHRLYLPGDEAAFNELTKPRAGVAKRNACINVGTTEAFPDHVTICQIHNRGNQAFFLPQRNSQMCMIARTASYCRQD